MWEKYTEEKIVIYFQFIKITSKVYDAHLFLYKHWILAAQNSMDISLGTTEIFTLLSIFDLYLE